MFIFDSEFLLALCLLSFFYIISHYFSKSIYNNLLEESSTVFSDFYLFYDFINNDLKKIINYFTSFSKILWLFVSFFVEAYISIIKFLVFTENRFYLNLNYFFQTFLFKIYNLEMKLFTNFCFHFSYFYFNLYEYFLKINKFLTLYCNNALASPKNKKIINEFFFIFLQYRKGYSSWFKSKLLI